MSKIVSVILLFIVSTLVYAIDFKAPYYDKIPITPKTWQEVDLSYSDIIKGKSYSAEIKLLRPIEWLEENGMDKAGNEVNLSLPEFGVVNVQATVTAIKPTTLDTSKTDWSKIDSRPVIGTFRRYAPVVKTYTFKDVATGEISSINATPNHLFYVKNKGKFLSIEDVAPTDKLVNSSGQTIKLLCNKDQMSHCGKLYNINANPVPVYNLEVYREHIYFVGNNNLLVHNMCNNDAAKIIQKAWRSYKQMPKRVYDVDPVSGDWHSQLLNEKIAILDKQYLEDLRLGVINSRQKFIHSAIDDKVYAERWLIGEDKHFLHPTIARKMTNSSKVYSAGDISYDETLHRLIISNGSGHYNYPSSRSLMPIILDIKNTYRAQITFKIEIEDFNM